MATYPTKIEILAVQILGKFPAVGAWQRKFLCHLFVLWLSIRGRHNFVNLARYGDYIEYSYRQHFARPLDFLAFNTRLVERYLSPDRILAFDPSYLSKSGKHTHGVGYHWSGCAGQEKWELEISAISAVDLTDKTALHLEAVQTVFQQADESLLDDYADIVVGRKDKLLAVSTYLVADAYFSRNPFVGRIVEAGFCLITRLKKNTYMRYLYQGPKRPGPGRQTQFDGQVHPRNLRPDVFTPCAKAEDGSWIAYEAILHIRAWKIKAKVVIVHDLDPHSGRIKAHRIYGGTDLFLSGGDILHMYQCRYQQEFLFRDAKQEAGLEDCQAYSWEKIYFHVNTALTVVSLAKAAHHLDQPADHRGPFSMADIKTQYFNARHAQFILSTCGLPLQEAKYQIPVAKDH